MSQNKVVIFATSNAGKAAWLERELQAAGLQDWRVNQQNINLVEIQSDDLTAISLYKAQQAFEQLKQPVVVMDSGFYINELNGFPGPYVRYMIDQLGIERIAKLVRTIEDRSCRFENVATYIDENGHVKQFSDSTATSFTLTENIWPHDHPKQWSSLWRILVPSGLGYSKPLAAFSDAELDDFMLNYQRGKDHTSSLNGVVNHIVFQQKQNLAA